MKRGDGKLAWVGLMSVPDCMGGMGIDGRTAQVLVVVSIFDVLRVLTSMILCGGIRYLLKILVMLNSHSPG